MYMENDNPCLRSFLPVKLIFWVVYRAIDNHVLPKVLYCVVVAIAIVVIVEIHLSELSYKEAGAVTVSQLRKYLCMPL